MKSNRSTACWPTFTWNYHNRNQSGLLLAHCGLCTPLLLLLLIIRVHHVLCITEILIIFIVVYKTHSLPRGYYITFQQSTRSSSEELLQSELALFRAAGCMQDNNNNVTRGCRCATQPRPRIGLGDGLAAR